MPLKFPRASARPLSFALPFDSRVPTTQPAINIYTGPGGHFMPHQDMQALTLLVALSTAGEDYEGGGTAFFAPDAELPLARRGKIEPIALLKPEACTALLWSGTLVHAGAEVLAGRRLVFVASFTPCT